MGLNRISTIAIRLPSGAYSFPRPKPSGLTLTSTRFIWGIAWSHQLYAQRGLLPTLSSIFARLSKVQDCWGPDYFIASLPQVRHISWRSLHTLLWACYNVESLPEEQKSQVDLYQFLYWFKSNPQPTIKEKKRKSLKPIDMKYGIINPNIDLDRFYFFQLWRLRDKNKKMEGKGQLNLFQH